MTYRHSTQLQALRERLSTDGGKILIIQTAFLGDVILTTPLIRATRQSFPYTKITALTIPQCADVLHGLVDDIIVYDKRNRNNRKLEWHKILGIISKEKFNLALIPHRSLRSGFLAYKGKIPYRFGFNKGGGIIWHTHCVRYPKSVYEGLRNLNLIAQLTEVKDTGLPELHPSDDDIIKVEDILRNIDLKKKQFALLAPGSIWFTKRLPEDNYRQFIELLDNKNSMPVLTIGGKDDRKLCSHIVMNSSYNLAGKLTVLQSAALAKAARFLISGDTAPAHIATGVGLQQVIIYGSTAPRFGFAPPTPKARIIELDLWCRPCTNHGRRHCPRWNSLKCLREITPQMIYESVEDWL